MIRSRRTLGLNVMRRVGINAETMTMAKNRELGPYQPTLMEVKRLVDDGSTGMDVPVATNSSGAKQDSNKFIVFAALRGVSTVARAKANT